MATWVYDGSFNGFLCLLFESTRAGEPPEAIEHAGSGQPFLWPPKEARTDELLAKQTGDVLGADEHRPAGVVHLGDVVDDRVDLGRVGDVDTVLLVLADVGGVRRDR